MVLFQPTCLQTLFHDTVSPPSHILICHFSVASACLGGDKVRGYHNRCAVSWGVLLPGREGECITLDGEILSPGGHHPKREVLCYGDWQRKNFGSTALPGVSHLVGDAFP